MALERESSLKKETAKRISDKLLEASKLMDDATSIAREEATPEEFLIVRDAVGVAMGELLLEVLNRLYNDHPDIKPKGLD